MADADGSVEHCCSKSGQLTHEFILLTLCRKEMCNNRHCTNGTERLKGIVKLLVAFSTHQSSNVTRKNSAS